jgi:XapX domain-containing protein
MKASLLSLGAGLVVGVVYSLLGVRSPAPPVVALIGLLGILLGEQIIPVGRQMIARISIRAAWREARCGQHVFGAMPGLHAETPAATGIATVGEVAAANGLRRATTEKMTA